jgi:phage terminase large subunit
VTDNGFCNPEYRAVLERLTGWERRAWLDGDWDIAAGQYFTTFRRNLHVVSDPPASRDSGSTTLNSQPSTLNCFDDTRAREWFAAMDYGYAHYTVVLLGCTDGDGNVFVVDEHAERMMLPEAHARAIKAMLARHRIVLPGSAFSSAQRLDDYQPSTLNSQPARVLARFVAGTDVFSRQSDGTSVAKQYAKHGIHLRPANTDRVSGWAEILTRLGDADRGIAPRLFIHQRCQRLLETLLDLQHDPNRPEDVLKVDCDEQGAGGDDAADALRYLVASQPRRAGFAVG